MKDSSAIPFEIIAKVLKIDKSALNDKSAMGETPNWDSLNHVAIIVELEKAYGIGIPNEDIGDLVSMESILHLCARCGKNRLVPDPNSKKHK